MARRDLDECAWCAEQMEEDSRMIGSDWKVYCSPDCARAGEFQSIAEPGDDPKIHGADH